MRSYAAVLLSMLFCLPGACDRSAAAGEKATPAACPVTPLVEAEAPKEEGVGPLSGAWHMNTDRSIWAMYQPWRAGVANKAAWIRPAGIQLAITGRRLDGRAPRLKVSIAGNYATRFQATSMQFPTQGCWEVTAKAGDKELRFVTEVGPSH